MHDTALELRQRVDHEYDEMVEAASEYWNVIPRPQVAELKKALNFLKETIVKRELASAAPEVVKACVRLTQAFIYDVRG